MVVNIRSPFWIKYEDDQLEMIFWPNAPVITNTQLRIELLNSLESIDLSAYNEIEFNLSVGVPGVVHMKRLENSFYGIWVPDSFHSLRKILNKAFFIEFWHPGLTGNLKEVIDQFHEFRHTKPEAFLPENADDLDLPPTWLLNKSAIMNLLPNYKYDDLFILSSFNDLIEYFLAPLTEDQRVQLASIPQELLLTIFRIFEIWISSLDYAEAFELFWHIALLVTTVYPEEVERFGVKFFNDDVLTDYLTTRETSWLESVGEGSSNPIIRKRAYFVLGNYYASVGNLKKSIDYLNRVPAIKSRTSFDYISTRSYINLAKIYRNLGDFTKSSFHYALALTLLKGFTSSQMYIKATQEYLNLKIAMVVNLLHHGIYQINTQNDNDEYLFSLLTGVRKVFQLFSQVHRTQQKEIIEVTSDIISITRNQLLFHEKEYAKIGVETGKIVEILDNITSNKFIDEEMISQILQLQKLLEDKQPITIKRVLVQMFDGRLIMGFRMVDGKLVRSTRKQLDDDVLFSSSISAVNTFVSDAMVGDRTSFRMLKGLDLGSVKLFIASGKNINLLIFSTGISQKLTDVAEKIVKDVENNWAHTLSSWMGSISEFNDLDLWLEPLNRLE